MNYAIDPQNLYKFINDDLYFIDIRDQYQFRKQHIKNFHNIPYEQLSYSSLPKDKPLCFICSTGKTTKTLVRDLRQRGYNAYYIEGGFKAFLSTLNPPQYF